MESDLVAIHCGVAGGLAARLRLLGKSRNVLIRHEMALLNEKVPSIGDALLLPKRHL